MTPLSRIIANILLPISFFGGGYMLLFSLGQGLVDEPTLYAAAIGLALLLAAIPPLAFHYIIRSQLKEGFALLSNNTIVLPHEITLANVLSGRIKAWKLFEQHLDTVICLQSDDELVYVDMGLDFCIPANERGKQFVKHYKTNMTVFEAWVQRTIYLASARDPEIGHNLSIKALMNEDDERDLRSKLLSSMEAKELRSVELPIDTDGLSVNREVRVRKRHINTVSSDHSSGIQLDESLELNSDLLGELGFDRPS